MEVESLLFISISIKFKLNKLKFCSFFYMLFFNQFLFLLHAGFKRGLFFLSVFSFPTVEADTQSRLSDTRRRVFSWAAVHRRLRYVVCCLQSFTGRKRISCLRGNNVGPSLGCALFLLHVVTPSTHKNARKKSATNGKQKKWAVDVIYFFYAASYCFRSCLYGIITRINCWHTSLDCNLTVTCFVQPR